MRRPRDGDQLVDRGRRRTGRRSRAAGRPPGSAAARATRPRGRSSAADADQARQRGVPAPRAGTPCAVVGESTVRVPGPLRSVAADGLAVGTAVVATRVRATVGQALAATGHRHRRRRHRQRRHRHRRRGHPGSRHRRPGPRRHRRHHRRRRRRHRRLRRRGHRGWRHRRPFPRHRTHRSARRPLKSTASRSWLTPSSGTRHRCAAFVHVPTVAVDKHRRPVAAAWPASRLRSDGTQPTTAPGPRATQEPVTARSARGQDLVRVGGQDALPAGCPLLGCGHPPTRTQGAVNGDDPDLRHPRGRGCHRSPDPGVTAPAQAAGSYVALGDSYSSGTGTRSYINDGTSCQRSAAAYPSLLSVSKGLTLNFRACSGATGRRRDRHAAERPVERHHPRLDLGRAATTPGSPTSSPSAPSPAG